jgi:hypothetical protein
VQTQGDIGASRRFICETVGTWCSSSIEELLSACCQGPESSCACLHKPDIKSDLTATQPGVTAAAKVTHHDACLHFTLTHTCSSPLVGMVPPVGLKALTPTVVAGHTIEPQVSLPMAYGSNPAGVGRKAVQRSLSGKAIQKWTSPDRQ